jgi:diacylglycerol kinase family enzyme
VLGVILNPNAHHARRSSGALADRLRRVVGDDGEVIETRTPMELESAIDRMVALGCDPIATCGGDGTNLSVVTELVRRLGEERLPRLAILRGGTVNTVAKNLHIEGRPDEILARLAVRLRRGEPLDERGHDLLAVNGMYGFLFAAAMGARFLEAYYGGPVAGATWATLMALRIVASCAIQGRYARWLFDPVEVELRVDGERAPIRQARLLLASVVPDVGIGMKVTWRAGSVPGKFHLVASSLSTTSMALQMPRVLGGRPLQGEPHLDRLATEVDLRFPSARSFSLDGDLFREQLVKIRMGPRIRIVHA